MTYTPGAWTCDGCDEPVSESEMVTLQARGGYGLRDYKGGWIAHYHLECWDSSAAGRIYRAVDDGRSEVARLERIPTAKRWQVQMYGRVKVEDELVEALRHVKCDNSLFKAGITSMKQVARKTDDELLRIKGVGPSTVRALREALAAHDRDSEGVRNHGRA